MLTEFRWEFSDLHSGFGLRTQIYSHNNSNGKGVLNNYFGSYSITILNFYFLIIELPPFEKEMELMQTIEQLLILAKT